MRVQILQYVSPAVCARNIFSPIFYYFQLLTQSYKKQQKGIGHSKALEEQIWVAGFRSRAEKAEPTTTSWYLIGRI